jgi:hypothetical protein
MENEVLFPDKVVPVKEHEPPPQEYVPDANCWPATVIVQVPPVVVLTVPWTPPIVALKDVEVLVVGGPLSEYDSAPDCTAGNAEPSAGKLATSNVARRRYRIIPPRFANFGASSYMVYPEMHRSILIHSNDSASSPKLIMNWRVPMPSRPTIGR